MALQEVSGWLPEEIDERREDFEEIHQNDSKKFDETYCLAKIPRQPDDYQGPDRYCMNTDVQEYGSNHLCEFHGSGGTFEDKFEKYPNMKHGMVAARENLVDDFSDKDQALYDWIVETYPDAYDIAVEEDPATAYDLHRLAAEIVRAERGRGFLLSEGEITETEVRNEDGQIVLDENGDVVTEKSEHYLAQMMHRQDKKITQLEKELGITRKEQQRQDSTDDAVEAIKGFTEVGKQFVNKEQDYDPDDEPWSEEDSDSDAQDSD